MNDKFSDPDQILIIQKLLRKWASYLEAVEYTLDRVVTNPADGHIPIWAREDIITLRRLRSQMVTKANTLEDYKEKI